MLTYMNAYIYECRGRENKKDAPRTCVCMNVYDTSGDRRTQVIKDDTLCF